ncbi:MAG: NAD(P)H-dependent oxidoreductase [Acidimicrobiia bacterium]
MSVVAVNGSPSDSSKTHALAAAAVDIAGGGQLINVGDLDADALLLRAKHPSVDDAVAAMSTAAPLVLVTPVYRATYSGLIKLLLDQLPTDGLEGTGVVLAATGGSSAHFLALDTGLRAVVASLAGWSAPTVVYATSADFTPEGTPGAAVLETLTRALDEATRVSR